MELIRFYCCPLSKSSTQLSALEIHHLAVVRRLTPGDKVELFDGAGALALAEVTAAGPRKVAFQVRQLQIVPRPFASQITIAVSIAKGDRFDWLIAKCTELGVDRICPVLFERTVKQPKNPKIIQRWQNIAVAAAKQCRRLYLPCIDSPQPLPNILKTLKTDYPHAHFLLGSLSPQSAPLIGRPFGTADVVAVIGPEGGITDKEEILLQSLGSQPVRLTDTVLRTETAALTFASILTAWRYAQQIQKQRT